MCVVQLRIDLRKPIGNVMGTNFSINCATTVSTDPSKFLDFFENIDTPT